MLLSIGMIVKNEEKYLRKCLESIQPLRDAVDSELIIVDTGSTDKTVEIAKEFTDNVLYFDWINDFSAARNVSLKAAKGEWYMFIDADEIYQSCEDVINFFVTGEYKSFNSAFIKIRSYADLNNRADYFDCYIPRLVKIAPETKFVGVVHEKLEPFIDPKRLLIDVVDHYGYTFTNNKELLNEKFERNSKLLQERLLTDAKDNDPTLYKELYDTYNFLEDKTQAIEYAYQGIELCKKLKTEYIMALYYALALHMYSTKNHEELYKLYDEYFAVDMDIRVKERTLDTEFYAFKAMLLFREEKYKEAYDEFKKFYSLKEKFTKEGICTRESLYVACVFDNENVYLSTNLNYAETCLRLKRYKDAEANFKKHPLKKFDYSDLDHIMRLNQIIDFLRLTDAKALGLMYNTLEDKDKPMFLAAIRYRVFTWKFDEQRSMLNRLVGMNLSDKISRQLVELLKTHIVDKALTQEKADSFIEENGANYPELLYMMLCSNMDISSYVLASDDLKRDLISGHSNIVGFGDTLSEYSPEGQQDEESLQCLTRLYMQEIVVLAGAGRDIIPMALKVGKLAMKYLNTYGESNITEDVMAAVTLEQINILRGMRNFKECVAALRQLIQINKDYAPIAKVYQQLIKADMGQ